MSVNPFDLKTVLVAKHAQHVVLIHFPIAHDLAGVVGTLPRTETARTFAELPVSD